VSIHDESGCILDNVSCVVDTGTTLIYVPTGMSLRDHDPLPVVRTESTLDVDSFNRYRNATGAIVDPVTQLLRITPEQYGKLKSLFFMIGGREFELTANAQTWPRSLNSVFGGDLNYIYLMFGDIGQIGAGQIGCINGYAFLERYYSVYDASNQRVGFASTQFTKAVID
jgi:Eukaryotic aspartyl protease